MIILKGLLLGQFWLKLLAWFGETIFGIVFMLVLIEMEKRNEN